MSMIRPYQEADLRALYHICLKTGDSGEDATAQMENPDILGHIYAAPYAVHEPELAFVLEDQQGVAGYILGTADSRAFYQWFQETWLAPLREEFSKPKGDAATWTRTQRLYHFIHQPECYLPESFRPYPAHLHIDLLPRVQRRGYGSQLMQCFLTGLKERGVSGVHLGTGAKNGRALAFYDKIGFQLLEGHETGAIYLGMKL